MKEKTVTTIFKYDNDGKLMEKSETITEKEYDENVSMSYIPSYPIYPSPIYPNYKTYEITCSNVDGLDMAKFVDKLQKVSANYKPIK